MKYSINNYVEAFISAITGKSQEDVIARFVKLLKKNGDIKHSLKIIDAIHKRMVNGKEGEWVNVETARPISHQKQDKLISNFYKKDHIDFKINPELIAGVRILINGEKEIDNSLANKLKKLFK